MRNIKVEVKVLVEDNRSKPHEPARRFASQREYDSWLYGGQPEPFRSSAPRPDCSKEEYDSYLYGGGG
jgi:hypothetical protein